MTGFGGVTLAVGCAAVAEDLARRRISNWTSGAALASGFVLHIAHHGWRGVLAASLGTVLGFTIFLVFYLLNGMGGGDVKLMAAGYAVALALRARHHAALGGQAIPYAPAIVAGVWLAEFALG